MKSNPTLAALVATTLALAGCAATSGSNGTSTFKAGDPTSGPYPAKRSNIGMVAITVANGSVAAEDFRIPAMVSVRPTLTLGIKKADAYIHAVRGGVLKVTAKEGEPYVHILPAAAASNLDHDLARDHSPAAGVPLQAGWYEVDIQCLSGHCADVNVTFDGKPVVPFAQPPSVFATLQ